MKRRGFGRSRWLAVDVRFNEVRWAVCSWAEDERLVLEEFGIEPLRVTAESEGEWVAKVQEALEEIGRTKRGQTVQLGIPGHVALTKFVRTPAIAKARRAKVVEFEAAQNIPYGLDEVVWDHVTIAENGHDLELMIAAAKRGAMEGLCGVVEAAGLRVAHAMPTCVALWHGYRWNYADAAEGSLIVELGSRSTHLVFVEAERFFVRTLNQMARGENAASRLQGEISRTIAHAKRQGVALDPRRIFLSGNGMALERVASDLGELSRVPVARFDALRRVEVAPRAIENGAASEAGCFAGVIGLAVAARGGEPTLNLLPATYRRGVAVRRRRPVGFAAAALVVAVVAVSGWKVRAAAAAARERVADVEARLAPLRALERREAASREQLEQLRESEKQLRRVVGARTAWLRLLVELQEVLEAVDDVWLDQLAIEDAGRRRPGDHAQAPESPRIAVSGRMLDRARPTERASASHYESVRRLLERLEAAPSIAAVEGPRFDNTQPGILRFEATLLLEDSWDEITNRGEAVP